jgi:acyl carrier protein
MELAAIREAIAGYVSSVAGSPVEPDTPLEEVILDSMAMVLYVSYIEKTFGIDVLPEDLIEGRLGTVATAAEYVAQRLTGG